GPKLLARELDNATLARASMGTSLGFHIVFAVLGVGVPLLMATAEGIGLWRRDPTWMMLARRWSSAFGILFAVGAVSGTVLSFELGLLWPGFMAFSGSVIGLPFSAEGFAFFLEAIFLGLYLYGWDRLRPFQHMLTWPHVAAGAAAPSPRGGLHLRRAAGAVRRHGGPRCHNARSPTAHRRHPERLSGAPPLRDRDPVWAEHPGRIRSQRRGTRPRFVSSRPAPEHGCC